MKNKKVLVIDDEIDFNFLMTSFFTTRNFDVFTAHTLADGLRILEEEKPDYIFLDNMLPDGFGWGQTDFILVNYPQSDLTLISSMDVPKTSASAFKIVYKPTIREELDIMFG